MLELAGKEMVGAGDEDESLWGSAAEATTSLQFCCRRERIAIAAEEKLGKARFGEEIDSCNVPGCLGGKAEGSQRAEVRADFRLGASEPQARRRHGRAKAESGHDEGNRNSRLSQSMPASTSPPRLRHRAALAQTRAAKIEAQHRPAHAPLGIVEHLHGVVDNFVVQVAAAQRVRMADQRGKWRIGRAPFSTASSWPAGPDRSDGRAGKMLCPELFSHLEIRRNEVIPLSILRLDASQAMQSGIWQRSGRFSGVDRLARSQTLDCDILATSDERCYPPLDPIRLTRQLCEIESTTYHEGAVGDFLAGFSCRPRLGCGKDSCAAAGGERHGRRAGMSMPESEGRRRIWFFPRIWTLFLRTFPSAKMRSLCMAAEFPTPRESLPRRLPLPRRCGRRGFGLGCCLYRAKSAIRPARRSRIESPKGSRFLINGEPTDNRLALASKGALRAVFKHHGQDGALGLSRAGRERGAQAGGGAGSACCKLELPVIEDVGPSTLNIGQIHGGHAPNVIADKAEAQVLVRLVGDSAPVRAALIEAAGGLAEVTSRSRFRLCGCARWMACPP